MIQIRPGAESDFESLLACDPFAVSSDSRRQFISAALAKSKVFVAETESDVAGFAVLEHSFFEMGFVSLVAVAPSARRIGIGLALLEAAEKACTTPKLFTSTNESNVVAKALFYRAGFAQTGVIENLDHGDPEVVFLKWVRGRA